MKVPVQTVDPDASTRDRLLQAAAINFREVGVSSARVEDIAAKAGVTTGALYKLFSGKKDLLAAALGKYGEYHLLDLHEAIKDSPGDTFMEKATQALVYRFTHTSETSSDVIALGALAATLHEEDAALRILPALLRVREQAKELMADTSKHAPVADEVGVDTAVDFLLTLLMGTIVTKALDVHQPDPEELQNLMQRVLGSFIKD